MFNHQWGSHSQNNSTERHVLSLTLVIFSTIQYGSIRQNFDHSIYPKNKPKKIWALCLLKQQLQLIDVQLSLMLIESLVFLLWTQKRCILSISSSKKSQRSNSASGCAVSYPETVRSKMKLKHSILHSCALVKMQKSAYDAALWPMQPRHIIRDELCFS